uniref:Uncharacterized protein n=1 Tax=viral metagenome TaxID=1070528 RepID=A0A6H1ZYQ0_9ZZZZ
MTKKEILDKMDLQRQAYVLRLKEAQDKHLEVMDKLWAELRELELKEVEGGSVSEARPF